jgi:energy-coupling factor transport system permease protein
MSQFEFLRSVNIGQYLPIDSPLHRLDGRARLILYTVLILTTTLVPHPLGLAAALLLTISGLILARIPVKYALRGLVPPLPFLLILAVLQVFFNSTADLPPILWSIGSLRITPGDFGAAGMLLLRFTSLILALSLTTTSLSTSEMTNSLGSLLSPLTRLGLPAHDLVLVIQITLRFIPQLAQSAERIAKAQAARGVDWGGPAGNLIQRTRRILPMIVPLFLTSLRRAETLALAMDARAYGDSLHRTALVEMHFRWQDALALLVGLGLCVLVFFL